MNSSITPKSTSSLALEAGPSLFDSPGGQTTGQRGREAALANHSPVPGSKRGTLTSATYGPRCSGSCESAALQSSLESRLVARLGTAGSMEYATTWKERVTPAGRRYLEHSASARRTSDPGCTGWPTPVANPANGTPEDFLRRKRESVARGSSMGITLSDLNMVSQLTPWPTPNTPSGGPNTRATEKHHGGMDLEGAVTLAPWPTAKTTEHQTTAARGNLTLYGAALLSPRATASSRDWKDTPGMATTGTNPDGSDRSRLDQLPRQASLVPWNIPRATDGTHGGPNQTGGALPADAALTGWSSPTAQDYSRGGLPPRPHDTGVPLSQMAALTPGPTSPSSTASTASRGVLEPAFPRWLQGFPATWDEASPNYSDWLAAQEVIARGG